MILTCSLGCQWIRCWRKIGGQSQKLAVSDVGWISHWRNHGWGSAMPTPSTCISIWLKWNPRLQVFPMRLRLIQLTSETGSIWLRPPILHQHLIHRHPRLQACGSQLLQVVLRLQFTKGDHEIEFWQLPAFYSEVLIKRKIKKNISKKTWGLQQQFFSAQEY